LMYPITRFCIEYVRGDELGKFNTSLTISQWVSIGLFLSGLVYTAWLYRRPARGLESRPESSAPRGAHPA
jgi:prolipoprotein diacylglyceryltransferase